MEKRYKFCILTTIGASIQNWFEPIFEIYDNSKIRTTFIANFDKTYLNYLREKYKTLIFINLNISRGVNPINMLKSFFFLYYFFKKEKFDLIEYHTPNVSFCASLASFFAKSRLRIYGQWGIRYIGFSGLKRYVFWAIEKMTCMFSTIVYAQSPKNLEYNIKKHICSKKKIDIIGIGGTIGVDLNLFDYSKKEQWNVEVRRELGIEQDEFVFGFIGRIHKDKGVNELIDAFKRFPEGKLLIIGDIEKQYGIRDDNYKYLTNSNSVIYVGRINNSFVPKYAAAIDLFVYPTYREGFGHILQQVMALGIPIVTTNIPGPSEVIEDSKSGFLIEPHSSSEVLRMMKQLYKKTDILNYVSNEERNRVKLYFDTRIMVSNIKDNYEKIMEDRLYERK